LPGSTKIKQKELIIRCSYANKKVVCDKLKECKARINIIGKYNPKVF
jgi:hypothetical protein